MNIPGILAKRISITPACRKNRGVLGAFDEAIRRLREEYEACQTPGNDAADFHVILTVHRPSVPAQASIPWGSLPDPMTRSLTLEYPVTSRLRSFTLRPFLDSISFTK